MFLIRRISNTLIFILIVVVNTMAELLPINGNTTGGLSNRIEVLITPAGYAFSIWSLIYILIGIWIIRQFPKNRHQLPVYTNTSIAFIIGGLLNCTWILTWHYEFFIASMVVMIAYLISLIILYKQIKNSNPGFFDLAPFSINLGWVSVATIVNIAYVLKDNGWNGFGYSDEVWTVIMLIIGAGLAVIFKFKESDYLYPLVFVWAFVAIGIKNQGGSESVAYTAFGLAAIIFIAACIPVNKKKKTYHYKFR
jgi:benzodiazapine receptor